MYNIILLIIATYIVHYFTLIIVAVQFQYLVGAKASCHVVSRTDSSQLNDFTMFYKMSGLKRFLEKFSLEISTLSPKGIP